MIQGATPACPCGALAVVRVAAGPRCHRCAPRAYGPHNERDRPQTVKITLGSHPNGKHYRDHGPFREVVMPVPESAKRFTATTNTMAHEAGRVLEEYPDGSPTR